MKPTTELVRMEPQLIAVAPSPATMLHAIIEKGVTADNVSAIEKLAELSWRFEQREAERAFANAFNALQAEMPVIVAESQIPQRGKYQRYEDIMHKDGVARLLAKHGFSVSFTQEHGDGKITSTCHLTHVGGHTRSNSFAVRIGGRADSETQADCKASTTAKRNALCNALNITIRQDCLTEEHDAAILGNPEALITSEQADELERRVHETNSNVIAFLKFAGASKFSEIPASKYEALDKQLRIKEQNGK